MANIGEVTEVVNATKVHLDIGSDRHILLQELDLSIERAESREATDAGAIYFFGQHDNGFEGSLLLSTPEFNTFVGYLVPDSNGALPSTTFKLIYTNISGASKTLTVDAVVPSMRIIKPAEGGVKVRMRFRITEELTASDDIS